MRSPAFVLCLVCLCGTGVASAQTGTSSSTAPERRDNSDVTGVSYVRRISAGITLSALGLPFVPGGTSTTTTTPNSVTTITDAAKATGASSRLGYGINAQVAITDRFAVEFGAFLRRVGYQLDTSTSTAIIGFINGIQTTTTSTFTGHEDTRSRLLNIPIDLRYYSKGRHEPGPRWFAEAGVSWQQLITPRSTTSGQDINGNIICCTTSPTHPAHRGAYGFNGGAGVQLIDPVGIRVVPEVRFTRWMDPLFSDLSAHTQKNQVEAALSFTF